MKKNKQLGIWMDHSNAVLMELTNDIIIEKTVASELTQDEKYLSLSKNEIFLHSKEQHFQSRYYKKLSDAIRNYHEVILFGPSDAKNELLNLLNADHLFEKIKIEVKHSGKMSLNRMHDFVRAYFKAD